MKYTRFPLRDDGKPLRPLTPIFAASTRRGALDVGGTPVTPTGPGPNLVLIYDTTLATGLEVGFWLGSPTGITIDWGDGDDDPAATSDVYEHTYAGDGTYTVTISGTSLDEFNGTGDPLHNGKLTHVSSWGDLGVTDLGEACEDAVNLTAVAAIPSSVTDINNLFNGATNFNSDISGWDVSSVTTMTQVFASASSFDQDISGWDVSSVTSMFGMFNGAAAFNQDLSGWCVTLIGSEPTNFDTGASSWVLDRPVWGTCP